jgi:hypothetical protein
VQTFQQKVINCPAIANAWTLPAMNLQQSTMTNELTFIANSLFDKVLFDKDGGNWIFYFTEGVYASSSGFWRLLQKHKISFVSLDNNQQFGLPKPIDLVEELNKILSEQRLKKIEVIKDTYDLTLTLTNDLTIEIYISSSGYETYDFSIDGKRYIGLGSGDIAIMDDK